MWVLAATGPLAEGCWPQVTGSPAASASHRSLQMQPWVAPLCSVAAPGPKGAEVPLWTLQFPPLESAGPEVWKLFRA